MKYLLCFCFAFFSIEIFAQTMVDLIKYLEKEQWDKSATLSLKLLNENTDSVDSDQASTLRYMYIKSVSGLLNQKVISKDDALDKVKSFENLRLILAGHPILKKCSMNCIQLLDDEPNTLFTNATNLKGTEIHSFEYVILNEKIGPKDMEEIEGKYGRLQGLLKSIEVEGNFLPRFRLTLTNGELIVY
jgi:hypothetical protein